MLPIALLYRSVIQLRSYRGESYFVSIPWHSLWDKTCMCSLFAQHCVVKYSQAQIKRSGLKGTVWQFSILFLEHCQTHYGKKKIQQNKMFYFWFYLIASCILQPQHNQQQLSQTLGYVCVTPTEERATEVWLAHFFLTPYFLLSSGSERLYWVLFFQ